MKNQVIPIEVSARHMHLSREDCDILFGKDYQLTKYKDLTQPSDFATNEKVNIINGDKKFEGVRIIGPIRKETQVEISMTDARFLGVMPNLKISGDLEGTGGGVALEGPNGKIAIDKGVIISKRHIHCSESEAQEMGIENGQMVNVKIEGGRALIFENVVVRVSNNYKLSMHIDTDEANAAGINKTGEGILLL